MARVPPTKAETFNTHIRCIYIHIDLVYEERPSLHKFERPSWSTVNTTPECFIIVTHGKSICVYSVLVDSMVKWMFLKMCGACFHKSLLLLEAFYDDRNTVIIYIGAYRVIIFGSFGAITRRR